jgi:hypothetical protein
MHSIMAKLRNTKKRWLVALMPLAMIATMANSCSNDTNKATKSEQKAQQTSYDQLAAAQPAHTMTYSPTRNTINFWIDTWNKPGKLAYVYLQNANGDLIGYYVLAGPPVSMCTALTPTWQFVDTPGANADTSEPAPGVDGAYYSGGECNTYYGKDATSGAYVEYTAGLGINVLLYDQPLPNHPNVQPLGPTKLDASGKVSK